MRDDDFQKLLASVKQADAIIKGKAKPSRTTSIDALDAMSHRKSFDKNKAADDTSLDK